ncbi:MAG: hypothetical protein SWH68_10845 [Thermodesulfobacteriota bacterium]|nr:hypothetical protein [Thermodesulfobacteriota bacterium]
MMRQFSSRITVAALFLLMVLPLLSHGRPVAAAQFAIPEDCIPANADVLFAPASFFQKHQTVITASGVVILLLIALVFLMFV